MHLHESTCFELYFGIMPGVKVIQNVVRYPPHHVTYVPAKFEVATSRDLGGYAIARKLIHYLILTLWSRS